jgi:hypothetical protein
MDLPLTFSCHLESHTLLIHLGSHKPFTWLFLVTTETALSLQDIVKKVKVNMANTDFI